MPTDRGYIALSRSILDWQWYTDINTKTLFIHMLLKANHKDTMYRGYLVKRGHFLTSYSILARETGLSVQNVRTSINRLKSTQEITCEKSNKGTEISIKNYDRYQIVNTQNNNELTQLQHGANMQLTTNNNDNKIKDIKIEDITKSQDDFVTSFQKENILDNCHYLTEKYYQDNLISQDEIVFFDDMIKTIISENNDLDLIDLNVKMKYVLSQMKDRTFEIEDRLSYFKSSIDRSIRIDFKKKSDMKKQNAINELKGLWGD